MGGSCREASTPPALCKVSTRRSWGSEEGRPGYRRGSGIVHVSPTLDTGNARASSLPSAPSSASADWTFAMPVERGGHPRYGRKGVGRAPGKLRWSVGFVFHLNIETSFLTASGFNHTLPHHSRC